MIKRGIWTAALAAGLLCAASLGASGADKSKATSTFSTVQKKAIEKLVRDYIKKHPEMVVEALQEMQRRREAERVAGRSRALKDNRAELLSAKDTPTAGNPKGDISIVEFFDYRCGYCKAVKTQLDAAVKKDGNVRVVLIEFPILGPQSTYASRAALAMRKQGKYVKFHNVLMAHRGQFTRTIVRKLASDIGADPDKMEKDMKSPEVDAVIQKNHALARKLNIRGTPAFVIGDKLIPGAIGATQFASNFERARKICKTQKLPVC